MMSAIQVKNVPEELHEALRRRAAQEGVDLQTYVLRLIHRDLALPSQQEWLEQLRAQPQLHDVPPASETLRAAREERERTLNRHADRD